MFQMGNGHNKPCLSPYCMHYRLQVNTKLRFCDGVPGEFDHVQFKLHEAIVQEEEPSIKKLLLSHPVNDPIQIWKYCTVFSARQRQGLAILPLHLAASYRRVKSLESLLSAGADTELRDQHGRTALHLVITHWPYILNSWPKPRTKFETAVSAMQRRAEACLETLCQHGVNIHAEVERDSRQTAVHLAVRYSALPALDILARHGARVDVADRTGMTPLHMACGTLGRDLAVRLINLGADLNRVVTNSGNTPLHMAAMAVATRGPRTLEADLGCVAELLARGADPDAVNKTGRTALHEACGAGREALVDLLLAHGAQLPKQTPRGENGLFLFLDRRHNAGETSLLGKLLCLTQPLSLHNGDGLLPGMLLLPQFSEQRDTLLDMSQRPRSLQDICKGHLYRTYGRDRRQELRDVLPERIFRPGSPSSGWYT
ncbi:ankyrin repeat domain-containing protein 61-like [Aplochiton taeniatus]